MFLRKLPNFKEIQSLWKTLSKKRKRQLFFFQIISLIAGVGEIANLGAIFPFLSILASPKDGLGEIGLYPLIFNDISEDRLLLILGTVFIFFIFLSTFLRIFTLKLKNKLASVITIDISKQVFSNILLKPYSWHIKNNSSKVLGKLTKDIDQTYFVVSELLVLAVNLIIAFCIASYLIVAWPTLMLSLITFLVLSYFLIYKNTKEVLSNSGKSITLNYEKNIKYIQDSIAGIKDIILNKSHNFFISKFETSNRNYRNSVVTISNLTQVPRFYFEALIIVLIILSSIILEVLGYSISTQLPIIGTITLGLYKLLPIFQAIFRSSSNIKSNMYSLGRIIPYLFKYRKKDDYFSSSKYRESQKKLDNAQSYFINLNSICFDYGDEKDILKKINLNIKQGEKIAIVGPSGSGKSTLGDIILGLLKPTKGEIIINGINLHEDSYLVEKWQKNIGHVPQFIYLSDSTIDTNIAFGISKDAIDKIKLKEAVKKAKLENVIKNLPQGFETYLGERGIKLSGGQIQRIGIARTLYKMPRMILLDEATSSLDNITEAEVMSSIYGLSKKITVIIIAHRLTTVKKCDKVVFLDNGKIEGVGDFYKLLNSNKKFKELVLKEQKDNLNELS